MRRHALLLLVAVVGCSSIESTGGHDAAVVVHDGPRPDAAIADERVPFTTTGMTPLGSLDDVRYMAVGYFYGFCEPGYRVALYRTNELYDLAVATFYIEIPPELTTPPTGAIAASAWPRDAYNLVTENVSFAIVQLDIPTTEMLRIAGRMTTGNDGWNVDFTMDAMTTAASCF